MDVGNVLEMSEDVETEVESENSERFIAATPASSDNVRVSNVKSEFQNMRINS